jgi:hypothetical protein
MGLKGSSVGVSGNINERFDWFLNYSFVCVVQQGTVLP